MLPWITKNLIYRPIYAFRGEPTFKFMNEICKYHRLSRDEMQLIQWNNLISLLKYLQKNNRYYGELFKLNNIDINQICHPGDFEKIPFLTKEDINLRSQAMLSNDDCRTSRRKTSGSTGIPLVFAKDRIASAYMDAVMYLVYGWHGIKVGDRQARIWGMPMGAKAQLMTRAKDTLLNRKRLVAFELSGEESVRYFQKLRRFRPAFLYGLVNTTAEFGNYVREAGFDPAQLHLKAIITTGEIQFPAKRIFLEEIFGCPILNEYGTTENGIIAFECRKGKLHILTHNNYVEIIDPQTGATSAPGEIGEIVITELHSYKMPFVRYRIGDLAKPSDENCACGLNLPVVEEIVGRISDMIVTPEGKKVSPAILPYSMDLGVMKFRAFQYSPCNLRIDIQAKGNAKDINVGLLEAKLRKFLGPEMHIDIQFVEKIENSRSGKFRYFVSETGINSQ